MQQIHRLVVIVSKEQRNTPRKPIRLPTHRPCPSVGPPGGAARDSWDSGAYLVSRQLHNQEMHVKGEREDLAAI